MNLVLFHGKSQFRPSGGRYNMQYTMLVYLYDKWLVTMSEKTMCLTIHFQLTNPSGRSVRWSVGRSVGFTSKDAESPVFRGELNSARN